MQYLWSPTEWIWEFDQFSHSTKWTVPSASTAVRATTPAESAIYGTASYDTAAKASDQFDIP